MHRRSIAVAVAGVLALAGAPALTACSTAPARPAGAAVTSASVPAGGTAQADVAVPEPSGPARSLTIEPVGNEGISDADLAQIDRQLSDAANALTAADHDAVHDEAGDSTP